MTRPLTSSREESLAKIFRIQLQKLIVREGGIKALSDKCDITASSIHHYLKSGGEPSRRVIVAIAQSLGVSLDWLLLGEGNTPGTNPDPEFFTPPEVFSVSDKSQGAGGSSLKERSGPISLSFSWVSQQLGVDPDHLRWMKSRDVDMEPLIDVGEMLLLDVSKVSLREDGIYLLKLPGRNHTVKEIQLVGIDRVEIRARSHSYVNWTLSVEDAKKLMVVGKVIYWTRRK